MLRCKPFRAGALFALSVAAAFAPPAHHRRPVVGDRSQPELQCLSFVDL